MYFLEAHLEPGSFKTCYADTDSMALALTKTIQSSGSLEDQLKGMFEPLVKSSMRKSWEEQWKQWFVTTNETGTYENQAN